MNAEQTKARIENVYQNILEQEMQSMPFIAQNIGIEMVGLQQYQDHWLGVMITPWMMNLMILPIQNNQVQNEQGLWPDLHVGEEVGIRLAGNDYRFYASEVEGIGQFLACSLMSPISGIANHAQAVQLATDVMRLATSLATDEINHSRRQLWSRPIQASLA
ncbi:MAG: [NiFe]-hydrogenase assembly chaperone HybE [Vibrio sp.]